MTEKSYKIVKFTAENVKKLTVVNITPDGNLIQITGKNRAGKTSVLDSIWWCLAGAEGIQSKPIREGADEALIRLDMGDIKVTRKFRRKDDDTFTTSLSVEAEDGSRFPSPQTMLDKMIGALSFDPVAFTRMDAKKQLDMLKLFVPAFDFDAFDAKQKGDYEKRTDENRKARELRAQAAGIVAPDSAPAKVDEQELVAQLEESGEKNAELLQRRTRREQVGRDIAAKREAVERHSTRLANLEREMDVIKREIAATTEEADQLEKRLQGAEALPEPVDTSALVKKIDEARANNEAAANYTRRQELIAKAMHHEASAKALTDAMEGREEHKKASIAAAKMPVPGLALGDDGVLLNGKPFDQASQAEQLRTSIAIAMAANPKIRVIRANGDSLDEDNIKIIAEMADAADYQVWLEKVSSDGRVGIHMVDGHVQNGEDVAPAPPVAAPAKKPVPKEAKQGALV